MFHGTLFCKSPLDSVLALHNFCRLSSGNMIFLNPPKKEWNVSSLSFLYLLGKWPSMPIAASSIILLFQCSSWHSLAANPSKTKVKTKFLMAGYKLVWANLDSPASLNSSNYLCSLKKKKKIWNLQNAEVLEPQLLLQYWPVRCRLICLKQHQFCAEKKAAVMLVISIS